jgi:hypothetical protein
MEFAGVWQIEIATPIGKQLVTLKIDEKNGIVTGTATQGTETVPFVDPVKAGDRLQWTQSITKPLKMTVKFDLQCFGDTVSGTAKPGIFPSAKVIGQRSKVVV